MVTTARKITEFDSHQVASGALRAFFGITQEWVLKTKEQQKLLGNPPRSTFHKMKKLEVRKIDQDTLERISYVLGIYKALHILFSDPKSANLWVHQPNSAPLFNGQTAMEKMLAGNVGDLLDVRRYLDAERGY